jgi:hypothetical protein
MMQRLLDADHQGKEEEEEEEEEQHTNTISSSNTNIIHTTAHRRQHHGVCNQGIVVDATAKRSQINRAKEGKQECGKRRRATRLPEEHEGSV